MCIFVLCLIIKSVCMCNKTWVYPITKVPPQYPQNAFELLKYYREQKKLTSEITSWKCYCCQEDKHKIVAAFVVDSLDDKRKLYLMPICLDCLKEHLESPDNTTSFTVFDEDLLYISEYDSSTDFENISIEEP